MIGHLLNAAVTVYRPAFTADGRGGRTRAMNEQGSIRARIVQPTDVERTVAGQDGATLYHVVHVAYGADVERGDELDTGGSRRLRVVAVVSDSSGTYKRLDCRVIEGA